MLSVEKPFLLSCALQLFTGTYLYLKNNILGTFEVKKVNLKSLNCCFSLLEQALLQLMLVFICTVYFSLYFFFKGTVLFLHRFIVLSLLSANKQALLHLLQAAAEH